jgi:3-oxoisoapionate decarboxylase
MKAQTPLGLSSFAYRWALETGRLDAFTLIDRASELGLQIVQYLHNLPLHDWSDSDLAALGRHASAKGITLQVGTHGLDPASMARYVEVARRCGAGMVRATAFGDLAVAERALHDLQPTLRTTGVTVALENYYQTSAEDLAALVRRVDDPLVGVCLDTINSVGRFEEPARTVATLAPFTVCLHLKDGVTRPADHGFEVVGTAVGDGMLDLPSLVRMVWAAGRRPPVLIELWQERLADGAATVAAEEEKVVRSIAYAQRLIA